MAIPINIEQLINERIIESMRIEYKECWNPNSIINTICTFANDIDDILKELVGYCRLIEPSYNPIVEVVKHMGKDIMVIWVLGGHGRPYKC